MKSTAVMKPTVVVTAAGAPIDMAATLMERSPSRLPQGQSPLFPARPSDVMSCAQLRQKIQQALPPAQSTSMLECYRLLADGAVVADDALIDIALLRAPALGAVPDCTSPSPVTSGTMPCDDDLTATPPARANGRGGLAQSDSATPFTPPSSHTVATFPPCLPPVDGSSPRAGFAFARNEAELGKHASRGSAGSDGCNTPSSAAEGNDLGRVSAMSAQCETSVPELELIALVHPVACTLGTVTVLRHPADAGDTPVDTDAALSRHPGFYNMVLRGVKDLPNLKARVKQRLRDEGIVQGDASPTSTDAAAVSAAGFNSESVNAHGNNDAHDEDHTHGESRSPAPAQDTSEKAVGDLKVSATDLAPLHDLIRLSATLRRGLHTELLQVLKDVRADIAKAAAPAATPEDKVKQIHAAIPPAARDAVMAMGFPEAAVDRALLSNRMDPELAINFLLSVDVDAVSGPLQDFEVEEFSAAFLSDSAAADTAAAMEPGVAELAAMGFPPKDARRALKLSNGDPNAAGDLLLRGLPDEEPSALLLSTIAEVIKAEAEAFPLGTVTLPPLAGEEKENGLSAVSKSRVEGEVARIQDDDEAEDEDAQAPPAAAATEENSATGVEATSNTDGEDAAKKAEEGTEESGRSDEQRKARAELAEDSGPLGDGANRLSPDLVERAVHYLQTIPNVAVVLRTHPKFKYALATLCSLLPRPRVAAPVLSQLRAMTQGSGASSTPTISLASASVLTSSGSRVRGLQTSSSAVRSPPPSMNVSAANSVAARQSQMQQAPQGALPPRQQSASLGRPSALSARSAGPVAPPSSRTLSANEASPSELHREEMRRQGHQAYSIAAGDSSPGPAAGVDAAAMQAALAALQAPHPASASAPAAPTNTSGESQNESPVPQQQQRASDAQGAAELYALLTATQESRAVAEAGMARTAPTAAPPASSGLRPSGLAATSFQQQLSGTTTPALRQDTEQFGESTEALAGSEVQLPRGMLAGSRRQQSQSVPPPPPPHAGHQHVAQHMAGGFHGGLAGGSDDDDDDEDEDELVSHSSSV